MTLTQALAHERQAIVTAFGACGFVVYLLATLLIASPHVAMFSFVFLNPLLIPQKMLFESIREQTLTRFSGLVG